MSYAAPQDMLNRFDDRIVGDLTSDSGTRNSPTELLTDPILQAMLDGAAGEIDMAILVGERYTTAELAGLTGVDQQILFDLNCWLAFERLRLRRGLPLEGFPQIETARNIIQLLREGQRVFASLPQEAAGLPTTAFPPLITYAQMNLLRDRVTWGYFTNRRLQQLPPG
jgi:phage gp36-like protein